MNSAIDYNNRKELHDHIIDLYNRYKSGKLITNVRNISQYNRRNLTAELAAKSARIAELENALEVLRNRVQDEYDRIYISGVLAK